MPLDGVDLGDGAEYYFNIFANVRTGDDIIPAGHEQAREEVELSGHRTYKPAVAAAAPTVDETSNGWTVKAGNVEIFFNKEGWIRSYAADGRKLLSQGIAPSFWRAPTDNDWGNNAHKRLNAWRVAFDNSRVTSATLVKEGDVVKVVSMRDMPDVNWWSKDCLYSLWKRNTWCDRVACHSRGRTYPRTDAFRHFDSDAQGV